ncbi:hypothetical protein [Scytonema sp. NUACC21]
MTNQKLPKLTREQSMRGLMPEELMSEGYMEADDFYNPAQDEDNDEKDPTIAELIRNGIPDVEIGEGEEF